ncbi:MAG TPA: hypothetical protein DC048_16340 [Planctomycetaceae bacterium]|nr:hypothetical protein [Planctomycetaceae bacterium]
MRIALAIAQPCPALRPSRNAADHGSVPCWCHRARADAHRRLRSPFGAAAVSSIFPRAFVRTDAPRARAASAVPGGTIESLGENLTSDERVGWNPHVGSDRVGRLDGGKNRIAFVLDERRGQARRSRW